MMTIKQIEVTVCQIAEGYINNDENDEKGVRGYGGKLDIRPPYQREFIYNDKEQQAVITTVLNGYPLNVMYWVKRSDDAGCSPTLWGLYTFGFLVWRKRAVDSQRP